MSFDVDSMFTYHQRDVVKPPKVLYHWSASANRESIEREGLRPGNKSNDGDWTPGYVCYGDTPSAALGLTHAEGSVDLWMIYTHMGSDFDLANEGREWRTRHPMKAWYVATREPETATKKKDPHKARMHSVLRPNNKREFPNTGK